MRLIEAVAYSKDLADWIGEAIDNLPLRWIPRIHLAGACFQVGLSHHSSIVALIGEGRHASALALLRPEMECFLRGVWINKAATDEKLDAFIRGGGLKIGEIIADLECASVFDDGRIARIKREVWSDFCDFTHCGGKTIASHFKGDELTANFTDNYLIRALMSADAWALMIGLWIVLLSDNHDLAASMIEKSKELNELTIPDSD